MVNNNKVTTASSLPRDGSKLLREDHASEEGHRNHKYWEITGGGGLFLAIYVARFWWLYPSVKDEANSNGDVTMSLWISFTHILFAYLGPLVYTAVVRAGCLIENDVSDGCSSAGTSSTGAIVVVAPSAHSTLSTVSPSPCPPAATMSTTTIAMAKTSEHGRSRASEGTIRGSLVLDQEVWKLTAWWVFGFQLPCETLFRTMSGASGMPAGISLSFAFGVLWLLRRAARRWNPQTGHHHFRWLAIRVIAPGIPGTFVPLVLLPHAIDAFSMRTVVNVYPLFLSLMEYIYVVKIQNNTAAEHISDEQLSVIARAVAATVEGSRVGMLLVLSYGNFSDLVESTIVSMLLESFSRNNLITIWMNASRRALDFCVSKLYAFWHLCRGLPRSPDDLLREPRVINTPLPRFKRIYLACKSETELWPGFALLVMKLTGWGIFAAMDEETGHLLPQFNCDWEIIAVIMIGEALGDVLGIGMGRLIASRVPVLRVDIPDSFSPGHSILFNLAMWLYVAVIAMVQLSASSSLISRATSPPTGDDGSGR